MNSNQASAQSTPAHKRHWLALTLLLLFALAAMRVMGIFQISRDSQTLRDCLQSSSVTKWDRAIEVSVGAVTLHLARLVLAFVDVPAEARPALRAVRGAEVGVYRRAPGDCPVDRASLLSAADKAMTDRGWDRLAGVVNENAWVLIYVPKNLRSPRNVKVALAVLEPRQLVVVSARSNLEPLMDLARQAALQTGHGRRPGILAAAVAAPKQRSR